MPQITIEPTGWPIGNLFILYPEFVEVELNLPQRTWSADEPPRIRFHLAGERYGRQDREPRWTVRAIVKTELIRGSAAVAKESLGSWWHSKFNVGFKAALAQKVGCNVAQSQILDYAKPCIETCLDLALERQEYEAQLRRYGFLQAAG